MKTLFIDTHYNDVYLRLYNDNTLYKKEEIMGGKQNSTLIMPMLAKLLENQEYDEIVVVNGPGSFTGVRLGVTIAKTLAYILKKPIKVIDYLNMMNLSLDSNDHIVALSDGNGFFVGEFKEYKKIKEYYYLNNSEFKEFNHDNHVDTDVSIDMDKVLNYVKTIDYTNPHAVNPIYIKLIGVEYAKKNS